MNFLNEIKRRAVIDKSLLPLIFGKQLNDIDYWYDIDYDLPRLCRDISLLYFGLVQAYCFALAHQQNKKLGEVPLPEKIVAPMERVWNVKVESSFSQIGEVFSYLKTSCKAHHPVFYGENAERALVVAHRAYEQLVGDARSMLNTLKREHFLAFLEALPLLRHTRFDKETMRFTFFAEEPALSVKASPFFTFLNFEKGPIGEPMDAPTEHCYILTSVTKGEKNNELFFNTMRLDETGNEEMDKKTIRRQVQSNENLKLLCKTANIKTQWYPLDECWCDLKFLNKMVSATESVLLKYCNIQYRDYQEDFDIGESLKKILDADELKAEFIEKLSSTKVKTLNGVLFDLFLTEGLFKTVRNILLNPKYVEYASSKEMFDLYLEELREAEQISWQDVDIYNRQCQQRIDAALEKLSHIVPKTSAVYEKRAKEIRAEWKTFYILQAAGIKTKNLFADVESILSIDDYYDMIGNSESPLEQDVMQVLRTLCVFYHALLENTFPFDEKRYFASAEQAAPLYQLSNHTLESLFDSFIEIAKKCEGSAHVEELLGRKGLGASAYKYLRFCKDQILSAQKNPTVHKQTAAVGSYDIFISYAHEDYDKVKPIVERWRQKFGLGIFFDESDIRHGQNWQKTAEAAMDNPNCKMVVSFCSETSVTKSAVALEIEHAHYLRAVKYPNDPQKQDMFLLPINLEEQPIGSYLPRIANLHPDVNGARAHAKKIASCISGEDVFITYAGKNEDEIDRQFREDYEFLADSDGRVVTSFQFDNFKLAVANFYAFLKYGVTTLKDYNEIHEYFNASNPNDTSAEFSKCIFPIVTSVKETRIKRDNIAIVGYELIRGKGRQKAQTNHILTSRVLDVDDYYCIPKYRTAGELGSWMVEPLLIPCDKFIEILAKAKESNP